MKATTREQLLRLQRLDRNLAAAGLALEGDSLGPPAAWFLGPKGENKELLIELVTKAIEAHCDHRHRFHPEDPTMITAGVKQSRDYIQAVDKLRTEAAALFSNLARSAPIFSMRHQGHMLWDQALPAIVGYFAAMLYNQNNVAAEASPITTWLEIQVGNDLCRMLGYKVPPEGSLPPAGGIVPWGHITCDGSVANIEALWAARNAKFFAVALAAALREVPVLAPAKDITVKLLDGSWAKLVELDTWVLLNLEIDSVVSLPYRIVQCFTGSGIDLNTITSALRPYTVQDIGLVDFYRRFMSSVPRTPVALVPSTRHYSWPKGGTLLGLGQNNILKVHVDLQARMDINELVETLESCLLERVPVIAVVAVIGSTEESAVDPLCGILEVRERFRRQGLDFAVHCDAAWGGYFASMYRSEAKPKAAPAALIAPPPEFPMSDYVRDQYAALKRADSITVDPHKAGYVPYPAGGLCYRNSGLRDLISLRAPVIFHSQTEPTVGIYGIEGSKPGAAAAAVYLAHQVIRPNKTGYGKILGQCVWTSKRMYCRLASLGDRLQSDRFKIVFMQMLPAERDNLGREEIEKQRKLVGEFALLSNAELESRLRTDAYAMQLFNGLGSDQVILTYSFNFRDSGTRVWNRDIERLNKLNNKVYELCSVTTAEPNQSDRDLILTGSQFDVASYGRPFVDHYCRRLGVDNPEGKDVSFLISTTMNPWTTNTPDGEFLDDIEKALCGAVATALDDLGY